MTIQEEIQTQSSTPESVEDAVAKFDAASIEMDEARAKMEEAAAERREICRYLRQEEGMKIREVSETLGISMTRAGEYSAQK